MILTWRLVLAGLLWLRFCASVELFAPKIGVPDQLKIWSILKFLFYEEDEAILRGLYPIVTGLEENESDFEWDQGDSDLVDLVGSVLSVKYGRDDLASLIPLYSRLYPMGFAESHEDDSSSNELFFILNGKRYENSDDAFYLKSGDLKKQATVADYDVIRPNEVVIGTNPTSPIVILYGCPDSNGEFEEFNRNLYSEAMNSGKLRYIWRPTCSLSDTTLSGIPIDFTVKETSDISALPMEALQIPEEFAKSSYAFYSPNEGELSDLDLKVASLIANHYRNTRDFKSSLRYSKGIINNFPLLVPQLLLSDVDTSKVLRSNNILKAKGFDYNMLGLYINGQNWKLSELDHYTLTNAITSEYVNLRNLHAVLQRVDPQSTLLTAKELMNKFSQFSLPNYQDLQPIKVDLHRIPGFSESVIYFNDIEIDDQYSDLTLDIEKFFENSKFGELPEYRQNWNEVIFVIDFNRLEDSDTVSALEGLNRAIQVITQGYPQRVGMLPLNTGTAEGIVNKIYELRDSDLLDVEDFLSSLPQEEVLGTCDYSNAPDVSKLLSELQISQTSIIINGEVYPFKKNTWHYLIAKIIKKDKALLQRELTKYVNPDSTHQDVDVRGILHFKSANCRHTKYTPDYFSDSTYSLMNNSELQLIDDRVFEYIKGREYNLLHTATLVDDFDTAQALKKLQNLLNTGFIGVRVRVVHKGALPSSNWKNLKKILSKGEFSSDLNSLVEKCKEQLPKNDLNLGVLRKWLPGLRQEYLNTDSFIVVNGRFIHLETNEIPSKKHFEGIIKREAKRSLDAMYALEAIYPSFSENKIDPDFIETVSATLTKMFYQGAQLYDNGVNYTPEGSLSRIDLAQFLKTDNFTVFRDSNAFERPIDVVLVLDPLEERSQKLLSLTSLLEHLPFVNLHIVIMPTEDMKIMPIRRIYMDDVNDLINNLSQEVVQNFHVEFDTPSNFFVSNIRELQGVVLEIHAFQKDSPVSEANIDGVGGLCLELVDEKGDVVDSCITMKTFGYGQFIVRQLFSGYVIRSCDPRFKVTSFALDARADYVASSSFSLSSFNTMKIYVEVEQITPSLELLEKNNDNMINIFTVLKDEAQEEENYKKMIVSFLLTPYKGKEIKFWTLDQPFITDSFKNFCEAVNNDSTLNGSIEILKYKWPPWLRPQRFNDRRMDVSKILFLDVIFPKNTSKILYMDPSSNPIDPVDLYDSDDGKNPFAMFKMTGDGYWEEGYWAKKLKENRLNFHSVEPAFSINLIKVREHGIGDKLRIHYQRLSADVNSLKKIDQDLLNDLQLEFPISALRRSRERQLEIDHVAVSNWLQNSKTSIPKQSSRETTDYIHDEL